MNPVKRFWHWLFPRRNRITTEDIISDEAVNAPKELAKNIETVLKQFNRL